MDVRVQNISAVSLPFAAGTVLGVVFSGYLAGGYFLGTFAFALAAVLAVMLAMGKTRSFGAVLSMVFFAGVCCGATAVLVSSGHGVRLSAIGRVRDVISGIAYPSDQTGAVVRALTTGDRSFLGRGTVAAFRESGASHILALSGLHLGIIYLMLSWLTAPLGRSRPARILRYCIIVGLSGFYAVATGASPSIVRAFLFILLGESARLMGRRVRPILVYCGALTIQLALNPLVIKSVGFQLSYLAMAGIFILYPPLKGLYPQDSGRSILAKVDIPRRIWEMAALSISCQVFTAPLAWIYFGTFPKYFLLTNLLAMPLTTIIMALSVVVILLSALGCCPDILVLWNDYAVQTLLRLLELISSM